MPETNTEVADHGGMLVRELVLRAVRAESREADFVCSTGALDSHGTILKQDWKLERYRSNPVVLWAHRSRELPVGQSTFIGMSEGQLVNTIKFASAKANPMAENVWQSILEGTLRGVSVGFDPENYDLVEVDGKEIVILSGNELYEISVTPIPSNPEALKRIRSRAFADRKHDPKMAAERGSEKETNTMDEKQKAALEGQISERDTKIGGLAARVSELETKLDGAEVRAGETATKLEGLAVQNKALVSERDAMRARAEDAESKLIEHEVTLQVGVKITADERDTFIKLRRTSPELYEEMLAQRQDKELLSVVIPPEGNGKSPAAVDPAEAQERSWAEFSKYADDDAS